jgi:hypothetical protein
MVSGEFYSDEELSTRFLFQLDSLKRVVKRINDCKTPFNKWNREIYVYTYENEKRMAEQHFVGNNELVRKVSYLYDEQGRPIQLSLLDPENNLIAFETADYDNVNFKYVHKVYNSDNQLVLTKSNSYNPDTTQNLKNDFGDYIKIFWPTADPQKKIFHTYQYQYDKNGNWIKMSEFISKDGKEDVISRISRKISYKKTD